MANDELARSYAQAIFEKAIERWQKQLRAVGEALQRQPDMLTRLDNPAESDAGKQGLVSQVLPRDADGQVRNFVLLLASKNEVHLLGQVLAEFDRYATRGPSRELAYITSAIELTPDERTRIEGKLYKQYGRDIDFIYHVDQSLLGGLVVRVGDRVIDGSVSAKLAAMRQKLESAH